MRTISAAINKAADMLAGPKRKFIILLHKPSARWISCTPVMERLSVVTSKLFTITKNAGVVSTTRRLSTIFTSSARAS